MLEKCRPEVKAAMDRILDTFGGADGGVSYYRLARAVEGFDVQATEEGNKSAEMLTQIVVKFARLIDSVNTP